MIEPCVLVAVDGGRNDVQILELAADAALKSERELIVLHVIVVAWDRALEDSDEELVLQNKRILDRAGDVIDDYSRPRYRGLCLQSRSVGGAIIETARHLDAELVVMGCRRFRGDQILDLGPAATFVLSNSPCPVLLWRNPS